MVPSIEYDGRLLVMVPNRPRTITQPGDVTLLSLGEVTDTAAKLERYIRRDGAKHPKYKVRRAMLDAYRGLLEQARKEA